MFHVKQLQITLLRCVAQSKYPQIALDGISHTSTQVSRETSPVGRQAPKAGLPSDLQCFT